MMADLLPVELAGAVSPYTGIVRSVEECLRGTGDPPLFRFACDVAAGDALLGSDLGHVVGVGGSGLTRRHAAAAAVGEAVERYAASWVPRERVVVASARTLGQQAVDPERFALFSRRQYTRPGFPFVPFDRDTEVPWIAGWALDDGRPAWLPAELVLLGDPVAPGGARIGYATSNGTACATTTDGALVRGLCELLERDAFMIVWANRLSLPRLDVRADEEIERTDATFFSGTGMRYSTIDLSRFHGLPSFVGVVRAPSGYPGALGVGAGTGRTVLAAWWKSLAEAFACRAASAKLLTLDPDPDYGPAGERVLSFEDHIRYYGDHARARAADFLDASTATRSAADLPELPDVEEAALVSILAGRVRAAGSSAYGVDLTSPDVRELGLRVTKVVAPELASLDVPHAARFLGGRRLYEAPVELGLRDASLGEDEINPDPHPFP